jgi:hypothetical protein
LTYSSSIDASPASMPRESALSKVTGDRAVWVVSVAIAGGLFALLANHHWVPGGDSELYLATARNLLLHHFSISHGYIFNGQPYNQEPPGWPFVLATAMTFSTRFAFLKSINMFAMLGSLAMAYPICRRYVPPMVAGAVIVMTALLSHVFPLTFWLHSDALFCLVGTASFLVALQIGEGRDRAWRIALLCVLCAAAVTVRYAGLLNWIIVAGALMEGHGIPITRDLFKRDYIIQTVSTLWRNFRAGRWSRAVVATGLTFVVTAGSFAVWRSALHVNEQQAAMIRAAGGTEDTGLDSRTDPGGHQEYSWLNASSQGWNGYINRTLQWGDWFSYLFWQPFRFKVIKWINSLSVLVGWIAAIPLLFLAFSGLRRRQWIWAAVALYGFLLGLSWPHPNARYLVPVAFFLLVSLWAGSTAIILRWPATERALRILMVLFVATFILCNGTLYGIEVWAQRSSNFYATYEAGLNQDLISASRWLINHRVPANEAIACSERYVNLSVSAHTSKLGLRVATMLTGRPVITIPNKYLRREPTGATSAFAAKQHAIADAQPDFIFDPDPATNPFFLAWARSLSIRYYLYQPPVSPWRALHFRVGWLEERATHMPVVDTGAGWRLYKIPPTGEHAIRILPLPPVGDWPNSVPGI